MGVVTHEFEVISPLPPTKVFKAFVLDFDNLFPKVVPHAVKSIELLEGDGGPGSIKKITFAEDSQVKYVKQKIEAMDKQNLSHTYSVIEGDALMNVLEKITYETKFEAAPGGGTLCKRICKYYTIGDIEIKEEEIKAGSERQAAVYKAVEDYLLANPHLYN
ncbi:major allergen Pru ar 1-like [Durio zibethinus]|uniref:Major allergen Pru ar 1-like n=1 Tax=Durio zibethinus TaxID=66656 RepID=A0A6P6A771_DURZI|nr:major allergen Pru ar 1-like [Durio zibethinus]